jgi:Domain of unknown function (DUF4145)
MIYHCTSCADPRKFARLYGYVPPHEGIRTEYTLWYCEVCKSVALFSREDPGDGFKEAYYRLWPIHSRHIGFPLPEIVRESYEEAVKCENSKAYLAAVVMVRRALEAVTKEYEPTARTLHAGIRAMLARGIISQELSDWGNQLRVIGNLGAHATSEKIDRQDAIEAIDFLQAMLEILYDLRPKFDKMRARRAADTPSPITGTTPPPSGV